jgi:hypothetical protein
MRIAEKKEQMVYSRGGKFIACSEAESNQIEFNERMDPTRAASRNIHQNHDALLLPTRQVQVRVLDQ